MPDRNRLFLHRAAAGELGLFRTVFWFVGIALLLAATLAEIVLDYAAGMGRMASVGIGVLVGGGEVALCYWLCLISWRAARHRRPDGKSYGPIAIGLAALLLIFQISTTLATTGITLLGLDQKVERWVLERWIVMLGGDPENLDQLFQVLGEKPPP
jgi:hypothetical protein